MKIVNMSRKDNLFWSLNIALSLLLCLAIYSVGHSEALAGAIYGQRHSSLMHKGILKVIYSHGSEFALAWTLIFTAGYLFRGSFESLKKGLVLATAGVILTEIIKLLVLLPLTDILGGLFTELVACAIGGIVILMHERVLV